MEGIMKKLLISFTIAFILCTSVYGQGLENPSDNITGQQESVPTSTKGIIDISTPEEFAKHSYNSKEQSVILNVLSDMTIEEEDLYLRNVIVLGNNHRITLKQTKQMRFMTFVNNVTIYDLKIIEASHDKGQLYITDTIPDEVYYRDPKPRHPIGYKPKYDSYKLTLDNVELLCKNEPSVFFYGDCGLIESDYSLKDVYFENTRMLIFRNTQKSKITIEECTFNLKGSKDISFSDLEDYDLLSTHIKNITLKDNLYSNLSKYPEYRIDKWRNESKLLITVDKNLYNFQKQYDTKIKQSSDILKDLFKNIKKIKFDKGVLKDTLEITKIKMLSTSTSRFKITLTFDAKNLSAEPYFMSNLYIYILNNEGLYRLESGTDFINADDKEKIEYKIEPTFIDPYDYTKTFGQQKRANQLILITDKELPRSYFRKFILDGVEKTLKEISPLYYGIAK